MPPFTQVFEDREITVGVILTPALPSTTSPTSKVRNPTVAASKSPTCSARTVMGDRPSWIDSWLGLIQYWRDGLA
jgi:hypothetical protein